MSDIKSVVGYLVFKRVYVEYANAISSPITYGFPAITGFLGAMHAMSRKINMINDEFENDISLGGVLIACHDCHPLIYRVHDYADYTFNQTRNPIKKDGRTAPIVEEGKCHLTVSLVVEVLAGDDLFDEEITHLSNITKEMIQQQRIAGGSVHSLAKNSPVKFFTAAQIDEIPRQLMPAFVLMNADQELSDIKAQLQKHDENITAIDALIDVCTMHHIPLNKAKSDTKWQTQSVKQGRGWLVPIPIGFQGISPKYKAGIMNNTRNNEYPSQYVESVYGLGKWVFPHRMNVNSAFWRHRYDEQNETFLVTQN